MAKRVNFYKVDLHLSINEYEELDYLGIKDHLVDVIEKHSVAQNGFRVLDLPSQNELHQTLDIFEYDNSFLFMRASSQKPSGAYLQRNYKTQAPDEVLKGISESEEGIEQYTYLYYVYATGILAIVNLQGAPSYRVMDSIFKKYNNDFYLEFKPIPNANGIQRIYESKEPKISQIEVEVPVPNAEVLQTWLGWDEKDILSVQSGTLKATMKISGVDRKLITSDNEEARGIIDNIKRNVKKYQKAFIRARAEGVRTQDYSFFDENFSYPIEINSYRIESGRKKYLTASELIEIYRDNLIMAYNENESILRLICGR